MVLVTMAALTTHQTPVACFQQQTQTAPRSVLRAVVQCQRSNVCKASSQQASQQSSPHCVARVQLRSSKWSRRTSVCAQAAAAYPFQQKDCRLVLEDGSVWKGTAFGAKGTEVGEVVFNTSITGYQEIMTDPSYKGQFVCFTHPHIGNVGINEGKHVMQTVISKLQMLTVAAAPTRCRPLILLQTSILEPAVIMSKCTTVVT